MRGSCVASRFARPAILALLGAASLAPSLAHGDGPGARGRLALELGLGGSSPGAPQVLLGAGLAPVDTGRLRLDLFARAGFSQARTFRSEDPSGMAAEASLQAVSGHLDLAAAWRIGRFEPFAGGGVVVVGAGGTLETWCQVELAPACAATPPVPARTQRDVNGSTIWGAAAFGGLRVALGSQLLLGAELRYQQEAHSRLTEAPISMPVGGYSGLLSATWRLPLVTTAPPTGAEPAPPPASDCAPGEARSIQLHAARAFLCRPDPVRGGHYCEARAALGQFVEVAACEAACRGGDPACSAGDAGAGCSRCVSGCAETTSVACPGAAGWVDGRPACVLPAGRYGLESERAVPAACAASAR